MAGEIQHDKGAEGLRRARKWLSMTTRVDKVWTHEDPALASLLEHSWPKADSPFSFDIGGVFRGEELHKQSFVGEVKNYKKEQDLPTHYKAFLAKCYVALGADPSKCDHFLWISWSPFQAQSWDRHTTKDAVIEAVKHASHVNRVLGPEGDRDEIDEVRANDVASRVWLITLTDNQDKLFLRADHYRDIQGRMAAEAVDHA